MKYQAECSDCEFKISIEPLNKETFYWFFERLGTIMNGVKVEIPCPVAGCHGILKVESDEDRPKHPMRVCIKDDLSFVQSLKLEQ